MLRRMSSESPNQWETPQNPSSPPMQESPATHMRFPCTRGEGASPQGASAYVMSEISHPGRPARFVGTLTSNNQIVLIVVLAVISIGMSLAVVQFYSPDN